MRHSVGDRVSREVFMDDGTWARKGDKCLPDSPLRFGRVVRVAPRGLVRGVGGAPDFHSDELMYHVEWEDGYRPGSYFGHGLNNEGATRP